MNRQRFYRDTVIIHDDKNYRCVVADEKIAVFAPHHIFIDEFDDLIGRTNYEELFAVSNDYDNSDGFEYTKVRP